MKVVALIPARGGSKRIPRKNMQKVTGFTLVALAIHAAVRAGIPHVYVSTEDAEIAEEAMRWDAGIITRPAEFAGDDVPMEDVVRHAVTGLADDTILVLLEPTAPLRTHEDIRATLKLIQETGAPAVRVVAGPGTMTAHRSCHGYVYFDAGLAVAIRVGAFREAACLFPEGTVLLHRGDARSIDVDEPNDLVAAQGYRDVDIP